MNKGNQRRIEFGEKLLEFRDKGFLAPKKIDTLSNYQLVVFTIHLKNIKTFRAILDLAKTGYEQDSRTLARTMLENVIILRYIQKDPEIRADLFIAGSIIENEKKREEMAKIDDRYKKQPKISQEEMEESKIKREKERARLKAKGLTRFNEHNWSLISVESMAKEVGLERYYKQVYWLLSLSIHPSAHTANDYLKFEDDEFFAEDRPNPEKKNVGLHSAIESFFKIAIEINKIFKLKLDSELDVFFKEFVKIVNIDLDEMDKKN